MDAVGDDGYRAGPGRLGSLYALIPVGYYLFLPFLVSPPAGALQQDRAANGSDTARQPPIGEITHEHAHQAYKPQGEPPK